MNPCEEYIALNKQLKRLEERKEELRAQLMAIAEEPPDGWAIKVTESSTDRLEGLGAIKDKSMSLFEALHQAGCVKTVVSTRLTVKDITHRA